MSRTNMTPDTEQIHINIHVPKFQKTFRVKSSTSVWLYVCTGY